MIKIEIPPDSRPDKIPEDSIFVLKFDHDKLCRYNTRDEIYWVVAMEATILAAQKNNSWGPTTTIT